MSSNIEWTDATWNPVTGCTRISEGCEHCYIERTPPMRMAHRTFGGPQIGATTGVKLHPERLDQPLRWYRPRKVFVCSMADLFHEDVPDDYIAQVFGVMAVNEEHTYQVLTKRAGRMRSLLSSSAFVARVREEARKRCGTHRRSRHSVCPVCHWNTSGNCAPEKGWPLHNVWVGVSTETQRWADIRIPALLDTPAAVRFVSAEPLLGPIDLTAYIADRLPVTDSEPDAPDGAVAFGMERHVDEWVRQVGLDWAIVGGESGPGARPMHPDWPRSLRDQCTDAGVAFHFKQHGEWTGEHRDGDNWAWTEPGAWVSERTGAVASEADALADGGSWQAMWKVGKKRAGRKLDGRTWDEFPAANSEVR